MTELEKLNIAHIPTSVGDIWRYTLITVDNNPIKIGNIVLALVLILISLRYYQKINSFISKYIHQKLDTDKDTASAIEKIIVFFGYSIYILIALQIANVPLNAFAFIGGAVVLGIGFGTQNLINNLISGVIITIEKPIKIGDIIEINDTIGRVISINARCTIINSFSNIDVVVPNSKLLENNLINWTYSDPIVRSQISIKIPHKADHSIVIETIRSVVSRNEWVLEDPESSIFLLEINETGAKYEINYFCDVSLVPSIKLIKSQINIALAKEFAKRNIDFAVQMHQIAVTG